MLPKKERISRTLWETYKKQKPYKTTQNQFGSLKYYKSNQIHVGVVVSGKHEKSAVLRNKLRRRVYGVAPHINGVFMFYPKKEAYTLPFTHIKTLINELYKHISQ